MVFKIGLLVMCQFYWATETTTPQDTAAAKTPHQIIGKIKNIYPAKGQKAVLENGQYVSEANDNTIIEIQKNGGSLDYFMYVKGCTPLKTKEQISAESSEDKAQAIEQKKEVKENVQKVEELNVKEKADEQDVKDQIEESKTASVPVAESKTETKIIQSPQPTTIEEPAPVETKTPDTKTDADTSKSTLKGVLTDILNQK
jgi:hypothetical protein